MKKLKITRNSPSRTDLRFTLLAVACSLVLLSSSVVTAVDYPLSDTGQTACYNNLGTEIDCPEQGERFYGQDGQQVGTQPSLSTNGDGTVTDNITGLTWQQTPDDAGMSWQEAYDYCQALELAGYANWRLPSTKELFSISNFSQGWPYFDTTYFDMAGTTVSKDEQFWTEPYVGITAEGGSEAAFGVNHGTGHIKAYPGAVSGPMGKHARCVRGNAYGANYFTDNGDGTVTDSATGLMWQQADSGRGMNWEEALAYAETSTLAGYDDWRLPNIKELQSIVDYTRAPNASDAGNRGPAIDTNLFEISELSAGTTSYTPDYPYFWSSTSAYFGTNAPEYFYAWYVAFGTAPNPAGEDYHGAGAVRFDAKIESNLSGSGDAERVDNHVRLVRSGSSLVGCAELGGVEVAGRRVVLKQTGESRVPGVTGDDGCFTLGPVVSGKRLVFRLKGPEVEFPEDYLAVCFMLGESPLAANGKLILKQNGDTIGRQWTDEIGCGLFENLTAGETFTLLLKVKAS